MDNFLEDPSELNLVDMELESIPEEYIIPSCCKQCRTINLTENRISSLDKLAFFPLVKTLILDKNGLTKLSAPVMPSVSTLWFNNNNVKDLQAFLDDAAKCFPNLTFLSFMNNPASAPLFCNSEADVLAIQRIRLYAAYKLPKLQFFDSSPITAEERSNAKVHGPFLVTRRPKVSSSTLSLTMDNPVLEDVPVLSALEVAILNDKRKPAAYLGFGKSTYDGRHSEGNRFITDADL